MRIEVSPADLARCRFGISPLGEVRSLLWLLSGQSSAGALGPWLARARVRYGQLRRTDPAIGTLVALQRSPGFNADFIHPPPTGVDVSFAEELAMVRATPAEQARAELARNLSGHRPPPEYARRILASSDVVDRLADGIAAAWSALVEPEWPRLRAILERDVVQRAGRLATYGWASALADLDPRVRWESDGRSGVIVVRVRSADRIRLGGKGLLFAPTVFGSLIPYVDPPWPYALVYRAPRGR